MSGAGTDIEQPGPHPIGDGATVSGEPESPMIEMLREMRAEIGEGRADLHSLHADFASDLKSLRADVASDVLTLHAKIEDGDKQTRDQIVGLRRAVIEYHTSVIGHGVLISELEARMRRVEQFLNLPNPDAH
jgi:hypothetical protein